MRRTRVLIRFLSTQVAEHLPNPQQYFSECFRLLKPGGQLICPTHGSFPDHGCPCDFQRWTADGLRTAGFDIKSVYKLTTGSRAFSMHRLRFPRTSLFGITAFALTKLFGACRSSIYKRLDSIRAHQRVVLDDDNKHEVYIGLLAIATKPLKIDER